MSQRVIGSRWPVQVVLLFLILNVSVRAMVSLVLPLALHYRALTDQGPPDGPLTHRPRMLLCYAKQGQAVLVCASWRSLQQVSTGEVRSPAIQPVHWAVCA